MDHKPSNSEITHIMTHLLSALNGVKINRYTYNERGQRTGISQIVKVPLKYGNKTRQIHEAIEVNGHISLPIIAVSMNGISLDNNRNEGKKDSVYDMEYTGDDGITKYVKPTPINIEFNVTMASTKGSDMEEMIAHYISVFNPYIYISWKNPFTDEEIRSKVTWSGSVSTNYPTETDSNSDIRYICDFGVTIEGWMFRERAKSEGKIKVIKYTLAMEKELQNLINFDETSYPIDKFLLSGIPDIHKITPSCVEPNKSIIVDGENFNHIHGIFFTALSGSTIPTQSWTPFLVNKSLSATYPPFDAYMLEEWQVIDDNRLIINIPESLSGSEVELGLINNDCGIVKSMDLLSGSGCQTGSIKII